MRMCGVSRLLSLTHTCTHTDRICVKQIWQRDTKSDWIYVFRKSQLTTQMGNINAKDYDIRVENTHQWRESLSRSYKETEYFVLVFCLKIWQSDSTNMFFEI